MNLVKKMVKSGFKAKLAIIGTIDSRELYDDIIEKCGKETIILTDERFTKKASDFLQIANIAVGTGRNFMEGCAAGCIMMAPVRNSSYPALVTLENIDYFEAQNFSDRTTVNDYVNPERDIINYIDKICTQKDQLSDQMKEIFNARYNVVNAVKVYNTLYRDLLNNNFQYNKYSLDCLMNRLWVKYTLFKNTWC